MKEFNFIEINSPIGPLTIVSEDEYIIQIFFQNDNKKNFFVRAKGLQGGLEVHYNNENAAGKICSEQLQSYFEKPFDIRLPVKFYGTAFQQKVWEALQTIHVGQTISYADLAERVGCKSARAVGTAVGRNPLPILVPCHRVINKNGKLGGFRGGLEMKRRLLSHEEIQFL